MRLVPDPAGSDPSAELCIDRHEASFEKLDVSLNVFFERRQHPASPAPLRSDHLKDFESATP